MIHRLATPPINAFTVDVEDYYQVSSFERHIDRDRWPTFASRVVPNTHRILNLLHRHRVRATFFILGYVAQRHPGLVRDIQAAGHEIASHGYWHRLIYTQTPDEFRDDIRRSRDLLSDLTGLPITAYRAPSFSITAQSRWALDVLAEEGFTLDSSVFPVRHDRYGMPDAPRWIHLRETSAGTLCECPPTYAKFGRVRLPIGGGGYLRLYPLSWTVRMLERIHRQHQQPFILYVHPWEVDPDQPRIPGPSITSRFRHYVNLRTTEGKLDKLLERFEFGSLSEVVRALEFSRPPSVSSPASCSATATSDTPSHSPI